MIGDEDEDDIGGERAAAFQEWHRARMPNRGPFPCLLICDNDETCTQDHEHNPLPGYEDHMYGCECDWCTRWYRSLK